MKTTECQVNVIALSFYKAFFSCITGSTFSNTIQQRKEVQMLLTNLMKKIPKEERSGVKTLIGIVLTILALGLIANLLNYFL